MSRGVREEGLLQLLSYGTPLKYYNPKSYHACPCGGLLSFYEGGRVEYTIEKDGKIWEKELKEPGQILLATTGGLERYIPW